MVRTDLYTRHARKQTSRHSITINTNCTKQKATHTDSGDGGDDLSQLEFVQDGGFSGRIQTHHQDSHLFLSKEILKEARKHVPHGGRSETHGKGKKE